MKRRRGFATAKDEMSVGSATDCSDNCQELRVKFRGMKFVLRKRFSCGVSNFGKMSSSRSG